MAQTLLLICSPLPGHQSPLKLPLDCDKVKWPFTSVQKLVPTITESPGGSGSGGLHSIAALIVV